MEDKAYICKITKPIGWCAKFEGDDELTDDEQTQKSKILNSITKFPRVQVILLFIDYNALMDKKTNFDASPSAQFSNILLATL